MTPELMVRTGRCLRDCSDCLSACEEAALTKVADLPVLDKSRCTACGKCAEACPTLAVEIVGRRMDISEVMAAIDKDKIFMDESGGGVTFSGGEPLAQPDFLSELLSSCKRKGIHTAVDTCGFAPAEALDKIVDHVDLFLYDLKLMDEERHKRYTGQSSAIILENLARLVQKEKQIIVRLPLVPGVNDDGANLSEVAGFLRSLKQVNEISLLPFHRLGKQKYKGLQKQNDLEHLNPPSRERLEKIKSDLESFGFLVRLGE
jgi:pyruvate formate lyase activating enzyme